MDTEDRYLDAVLRWDTSVKTTAVGDIPIDGIVEFRYPRYQDDQPDEFRPDEDGYFWRVTFPFRDHRKDDEPWFRLPDEEKWKRHPIWKWKNPEEPVENATLSPSIGMKGDDGMDFHCYIRGGEIDWL